MKIGSEGSGVAFIDAEESDEGDEEAGGVARWSTGEGGGGV